MLNSSLATHSVMYNQLAIKRFSITLEYSFAKIHSYVTKIIK